MKLPIAGGSQLERIGTALRGMDEATTLAWFGSPAHDRLLKSTISLCPVCLGFVPALVYEHGGRVVAAKRCATHGDQRAVWENDARWYHLSNKDRSGRAFAPDRVVTIPELGTCCADNACGPGEGADQLGNKTCTILIEVTNACNLRCAVCYSDAKGDRFLPLDAFEARMSALIEQKGGLDSVQLTGGEATMHPEFEQLIAFLHRHSGVKKIYLPTNGLLFAKHAERLVPYRDKLMVLLQYDGKSANAALRNADPQVVKDKVIALCGELGLFVQLTMTLDVDTNADCVGEVVRVAARHEHVKVVALQPATWSGRYDLAVDPMRRSTLSDVVKAVVRQSGLRVRDEDFEPIPCSHPNCGWITVFAPRFGLVQNLVPWIDLDKVMNQVAYKTMLSTDELQGVMGTTRSLVARAGRKLVRSTDIFTVAIKPFMDRYTYDQDRVVNCCHHLMDTKGTPVSFCEYNARLRPGDDWSKFPLLPPA